MKAQEAVQQMFKEIQEALDKKAVEMEEDRSGANELHLPAPEGVWFALAYYTLMNVKASFNDLSEDYAKAMVEKNREELKTLQELGQTLATVRDGLFNIVKGLTGFDASERMVRLFIDVKTNNDPDIPH